MDLWTDTKYWLRSGSLKFARDRLAPSGSPTSFFTWKKRTIFYRPGTSDTEILYKILLKPSQKREYQLPQLPAEPVVMDIGANIGAFSLLTLDAYPGAKVFAFEPESSNYDILKLNLMQFPSAEAFHYGLGKETEQVSFYASDNPSNLGGYSRFEAGSDASHIQTLDVKNVKTVMANLPQVDLLKVDTEGAEFEILTSMDPSALSGVRWILGELHGQRDFELLAYLSQWFEVELRKSLGNRLSTFRARNKREISPTT